MASITHPNFGFPLGSFNARVESPRDLLGLCFGEVWAYLERLYFFAWRDVKIRYKQSAMASFRSPCNPSSPSPSSSSFGCCLSCRLSCFAPSLALSLALWIDPLNI
jgi:hypothetical protein